MKLKTILSFLLDKREGDFNRLYFAIVAIVRTTLAIAIGFSIYTQDWIVLFISIITLLLTWLPHIVEKRYRIDIPTEFEIIVIIFVYATLFLGEVRGYYTRYLWWDLLVHAGSAVSLGFVGFIILYVLYKGNKINARPITIAMFSFFFALGIGALWEIFEFGMDSIFGLNMQKTGLSDTMWDLIVNALGALIASFIGFLYLKKGEFVFFDNTIKRFVKGNPELFEKIKTRNK